MEVCFESLSQQLANDPSPEALFRVFVMTSVYIIDCLSLENHRIAALASKIELAAHRSAAFLIPFGFAGKLGQSMRSTWEQKLPLLEFARWPCKDLWDWRNGNIFQEVSSKKSFESNLANVLKHFEDKRTEAGRPTPRSQQWISQQLSEQGVSQGPVIVPRL
ncbi:MAG: hypothetical protein E3J21_11720 [Anaerolineales bacterium]|nr:MAG: hypothetical protein E3J21_11720 [Anaerolineales bacterium]